MNVEIAMEYKTHHHHYLSKAKEMNTKYAIKDNIESIQDDYKVCLLEVDRKEEERSIDPGVKSIETTKRMTDETTGSIKVTKDDPLNQGVVHNLEPVKKRSKLSQLSRNCVRE